MGFYVICLVALCERWAAYTLASSLVLMLCQRYGSAREDALRLAALSNMMGFLGTLPGGLLADRKLGHGRALLLSTILLSLGYAALTGPTRPAIWGWGAIGLLIAGSALFKPSTQALIAKLHPAGSASLDSAQIGFYLAVNVGVASGAIAGGLLIRHSGWSTTFTLAAAAMLVCCVLVWVSRSALQTPAAADPLLQSDTPDLRTMTSKQRALGIGSLALAILLYTACYGQIEGALLFWAQERADRVVLGFEVPAAWFVALPALLVVLFGPAQLALLARLKQRIGTSRLVAAGLLIVGLSYVVLLPVTLVGDVREVSMVWLVVCLTLFVIGELLVAPLGLSMLVRLAPPHSVGFVVGIWYVSGALGYWLAGEIGVLWTRWSPLAGLGCLAILPLVGAVLLLATHSETIPKKSRQSSQ